MKKCFCMLPVVFCMSITMTACNQDMSNYLRSHISEKCDTYFVGETNDFYIDLFSGLREKTYKLDGVSTELVPYTIVSVKCKSDLKFDELQYCVEVEDKTYEGAFSQNPYDGSQQADLGVAVGSSESVYVYVKFADTTEVATLKCVSKDFLVGPDTVLDIAVDEVLAQNVDLQPSKTYECFVQVLNKDNATNLYFWLVNIVSSEGEIYTIIVDTGTGQVLAKKL